MKNISKIYPSQGIPVTAVNDISIQIEANSFISIMGKSGSGKSTLLHIMGTLTLPTSGSLFIKDNYVDFKNKKQLTALRQQEIGFIFQNFYLLPEYNVWDNICMPVYLARKIVDISYVDTLCEILHLSDRLFFKPSQLSGGEQQRVAIARAMANKPDILLADEPTGNLDYHTGHEVMKCLIRSKELFSQTIIMVTHDKEWAGLADHTLNLVDGKMYI